MITTPAVIASNAIPSPTLYHTRRPWRSDALSQFFALRLRVAMLSGVPLEHDALSFRANDDSVVRHHLDRIEAFGENPQLASASAAHNPKRQRHGAD